MAVVLHTTHGDLPVLLHVKQCPRACFNFLGLCASSYYDGCAFFRHMEGVLLQTGDPTGTGKGGSSIYSRIDLTNDSEDEIRQRCPAGIAGPSRYFDDEGFGVTTHHQRGVLSMAHKGSKANTNASQFFILCSPQPSFDGQYTAFGEVVLSGEGLECSGEDTLQALEAACLPVNEKGLVQYDEKKVARITGATIVANPFSKS